MSSLKVVDRDVTLAVCSTMQLRYAFDLYSKTFKFGQEIDINRPERCFAKGGPHPSQIILEK